MSVRNISKGTITNYIILYRKDDTIEKLAHAVEDAICKARRPDLGVIISYEYRSGAELSGNLNMLDAMMFCREYEFANVIIIDPEFEAEYGRGIYGTENAIKECFGGEESFIYFANGKISKRKLIIITRELGTNVYDSIIGLIGRCGNGAIFEKPTLEDAVSEAILSMKDSEFWEWNRK